MALSEKTQAFLIAKYYEYLVQTFGERGKQAFIHAVKHYGMQRGSRMAQRAIRDGQPLNYETFCKYGEWIPSKEAIETNTCTTVELISTAPDYEYHVPRCAWRQAFYDIDATEAGRSYCSYLDEAINEGFNGAIQFHTKQIQYGKEKCIFIVNNSGFTPDSDTTKIMKYVKEFDYHCAHLYYSFKEIVTAIFDEAGKDVCRKVLEAFEGQYGKEMLAQLTQYQHTNFNCC